ncbi:MAG: stage III sporulation protein AB [Lachnospiraceae bacterium]|nr:stage III sporulation protein AB [Lachnospiraceae bacterium]
MWQKLIAGACVMTGALGFGWSLCGEMSRDIQHLKIQKQILLYIMGEITYLHRPMEEIFDMVSEKTEPPYEAFFKEVSQRMKERDGMTLLHIWNKAVQEMRCRINTSQIGLGYLEKMGDCFAYEGGQLQVEALGLFDMELDNEIDRLKTKKDENSRLIKALSTLTGILCIILFL